MKKSKPASPISNLDVLESISDQLSMDIITAIYNNVTNAENLMQILGITHKQYYSRMSELVKADLVSRRNGKYFLTAFGKIVYDAQTTIEKALGNYWKLKAIDRLENSDHIPKEEYNEIIRLLIDNESVKEQLIIETRAISNKEFPNRSLN